MKCGLAPVRAAVNSDVERQGCAIYVLTARSVGIPPSMRMRELLRILPIGERPHMTRVQTRTADDTLSQVISVVREAVDTGQAAPEVLGSRPVDAGLHDAITVQTSAVQTHAAAENARTMLAALAELERP